MNKFFDDLLKSVRQMDEIRRAERQPSREFSVDALQAKEIRRPPAPRKPGSRP